MSSRLRNTRNRILHRISCVNSKRLKRTIRHGILVKSSSLPSIEKRRSNTFSHPSKRIFELSQASMTISPILSQSENASLFMHGGQEPFTSTPALENKLLHHPNPYLKYMNSNLNKQSHKTGNCNDIRESVDNDIAAIEEIAPIRLAGIVETSLMLVVLVKITELNNMTCIPAQIIGIKINNRAQRDESASLKELPSLDVPPCVIIEHVAFKKLNVKLPVKCNPVDKESIPICIIEEYDDLMFRKMQ